MYIDKVVIIEIKQTCHTVWLHWEDISICFYLLGQVKAESMFLMAAAIAYRYSHLSKGNDAQH
jgi:hypothetical protein